MMNNNYTEIECTNVRKFLSPYEDAVKYVIKTGFKDLYMVVDEDAHEIDLGKVKLVSEEQLIYEVATWKK